MKKKYVTVLIASVLLGLTACGGTGSDAPSDSNTQDAVSADSRGQESQTETEGEQTDADNTGEFNDDWAAASREAQPVQMGESVTEDQLITFSVEKTYWADEIIPAEPEGNYSYIEQQEGNCFLICEGTVQNLTSEAIELSSSMGPLWGAVATVFIFDDTEAYYGDWYAGAGSLSFSLDAGGEDTLYIAAAVPEEMKDRCEKVQVLTGFSDLREQAGTPMGTETGINWPSLQHKYLLEIMLM